MNTCQQFGNDVFALQSQTFSAVKIVLSRFFLLQSLSGNHTSGWATDRMSSLHTNASFLALCSFCGYFIELASTLLVLPRGVPLREYALAVIAQPSTLQLASLVPRPSHPLHFPLPSSLTLSSLLPSSPPLPPPR